MPVEHTYEDGTVLRILDRGPEMGEYVICHQFFDSLSQQLASMVAGRTGQAGGYQLHRIARGYEACPTCRAVELIVPDTYKEDEPC